MSQGYGLRFYGDLVLSTPSHEVERIEDLPRDLLPTMHRVLEEYKALGVAAQQVGALDRVALMRIGGKVVTAINLRIVQRSKARVVSPAEGCLSLQHDGQYFRTNVVRRSSVTVEYMDENGGKHRRRLEGFDAIIAQHECDHLDGHCIADGLTRQQRRQMMRTLGRPLSHA